MVLTVDCDGVDMPCTPAGYLTMGERGYLASMRAVLEMAYADENCTSIMVSIFSLVSKISCSVSGKISYSV